MLRNFWVIVLFVLSGIAIGLISPDVGKGLLQYGKFYLTLLGMSVTPIVFSAVTGAVGRLLRRGTEGNLIKRIGTVFTIAVLIGSTVGVVGALIAQPGASLEIEKRQILGRFLQQVDVPKAEQESDRASSISFIAREVIPDNIFRVFVDDRKLAIVFLSLLMGVAIGVSNSDSSLRLLEVFDAVYEIFVRILNWILYLLPLGLCALTAGLTAHTGSDILYAISRILIGFYLCCGFMWLVYVAAIRLVTGLSVPYIFTALREPLTLAFFSNSLVAMPLAMKHLEERLHQPVELVRTVFPLGVSVNRHAYPLLFSFMSVFVAQVSHADLTYYDLVQIIVTSGLIGMAAVGNAAVVAPLMAVVLQPLGLPHTLAVIIIVQCTGVLNPMVKLTNVFGCCATATILAARRSQNADT